MPNPYNKELPTDLRIERLGKEYIVIAGNDYIMFQTLTRHFAEVLMESWIQAANESKILWEHEDLMRRLKISVYLAERAERRINWAEWGI